MSLASANGPSVTVFCLPFTSLPLRSRGWPWSLMWPRSPSPLSQFIHFCITCCISAGDPSRDPPRYKNTNSLITISPRLLDFLLRTVRRFNCGLSDIFVEPGRKLNYECSYLFCDPGVFTPRSIEGCAGGGVQDSCIRRVPDGGRNLQKAGLRDLRDRLVLRDVQLASQKVHGVLDRPAVDIGHCSNANHPNAERTDLEGEICGEILDGAKCRTYRGHSRNMCPGRAASDQDDHTGVLLDHMARRGAAGDKAGPHHRCEGHHELLNR